MAARPAPRPAALALLLALGLEAVRAFASLVPPADACTDTQPMCAEWAAAGECENNPNFMLTGCADSCTRCKEGPAGVGKMRSAAERLRRRDNWCGDNATDCAEIVRAGGCHNGSDAPLRCPGSCGVCSFMEIVKESYECKSEKSGLANRVFPSLAERNCEKKRQRCARPPGTQSAVEVGSISKTMQRILRDFPQYKPRALSYPGGAHGEKAPWVVHLQVRP